MKFGIIGRPPINETRPASSTSPPKTANNKFAPRRQHSKKSRKHSTVKPDYLGFTLKFTEAFQQQHEIQQAASDPNLNSNLMPMAPAPIVVKQPYGQVAKNHNNFFHNADVVISDQEPQAPSRTTATSTTKKTIKAFKLFSIDDPPSVQSPEYKYFNELFLKQQQKKSKKSAESEDIDIVLAPTATLN